MLNQKSHIIWSNKLLNFIHFRYPLKRPLSQFYNAIKKIYKNPFNFPSSIKIVARSALDYFVQCMSEQCMRLRGSSLPLLLLHLPLFLLQLFLLFLHLHLLLLSAGHVDVAAVARQKCHSDLKLLLAIWLLSCRTSYSPLLLVYAPGADTPTQRRAKESNQSPAVFPVRFPLQKRQPIAFCPALSGKVALFVCMYLCMGGEGKQNAFLLLSTFACRAFSSGIPLSLSICLLTPLARFRALQDLHFLATFFLLPLLLLLLLFVFIVLLAIQCDTYSTLTCLGSCNFILA